MIGGAYDFGLVLHRLRLRRGHVPILRALLLFLSFLTSAESLLRQGKSQNENGNCFVSSVLFGIAEGALGVRLIAFGILACC